MLTVLFILVGTAFLCTIAAALSPPKCPVWVPVLLLCIIVLLEHIPLGK